MTIHRAHLPIIDINPPSGDFHRKVHIRNLERIKHEMKIEKRNQLEYTLKKSTEQITKQKIVNKEVAEKYRMLNII